VASQVVVNTQSLNPIALRSRSIRLQHHALRDEEIVMTVQRSGAILAPPAVCRPAAAFPTGIEPRWREARPGATFRRPGRTRCGGGSYHASLPLAV
jgi:hypothetical protein